MCGDGRLGLAQDSQLCSTCGDERAEKLWVWVLRKENSSQYVELTVSTYDNKTNEYRLESGI